MTLGQRYWRSVLNKLLKNLISKIRQKKEGRKTSIYSQRERCVNMAKGLRKSTGGPFGS